MPDTFQSILIGGVAGVVSAVITYFGTRAKIRLDVAAQYDKTLQDARLKAYIELWAMMEPLARYAADPLTPDAIRDVHDRSRSWYFKVGGIYLTEPSREPYFYWKRQMQEFLDADAQTPAADLTDEDRKARAEASAEKINKIVHAGSRLRTSLSDDIGTKRLSRI